MKEFPPLEEYFDPQGQRHVPKVHNPTTIEADGTKKNTTQTKAVLNWQTDNLLSQNRVLSKIEKNVDAVQTSLSTKTLSLRQVIQQCQSWIDSLHYELCSMISSQNYIKTIFLDKEAEMIDLKNQITFLIETRTRQQEQHKPLLQPSSFLDWTYFTPQ